MVLIPVLAEIIRPIVEPQGESLRTMNSWKGIEEELQRSFIIEEEMASVA
jgi:hypothetical protein